MILHRHSPAQAHPILGTHLSIAGGFARAIDRAVATGCQAVQIFTKSSNQWRARPLKDNEVSEFRERVDDTLVGPVVAHASYLINLASPNPQLRRRSTDALSEELQRADSLGLAGLVLHPGAYTSSSEDEGLSRIAESITEVLRQRSGGTTELLLEQTAGQGTVLGHRFEHLHSILDRVDSAARIGICLDTCHMVAAGYNIISSDGYAAVFEEFETIIGCDRLKLFHLNDSKTPLGSRVDRHENIGQGHIGEMGFLNIISHTAFKNVPFVLEVPGFDGGGPDTKNVCLLKALRTKAGIRD